MSRNRKLHTWFLVDSSTGNLLMEGKSWHVDCEDAVAYGKRVAGKEFPANPVEVSAILSAQP